MSILGPGLIEVLCFPSKLTSRILLASPNGSFASRRGLVSVDAQMKILWAGRYDMMTRRFYISLYTSVVLQLSAH